MTPDHTPFLRPGVDLITAEDVAQWLGERAEAAKPGHYGHHERDVLRRARADLRARLDRERRQACRRAALSEWQDFARRCRAHEGIWSSHFTNAVLDDACDRGSIGKTARESLARALAYRAAARAR